MSLNHSNICLICSIFLVLILQLSKYNVIDIILGIDIITLINSSFS